MNQIQQVVFGMNQTGTYSVEPILFPLSQTNVNAVRSRLLELRKRESSISPSLARKALNKLDTADSQLECIQWQLNK